MLYFHLQMGSFEVILPNCKYPCIFAWSRQVKINYQRRSQNIMNAYIESVIETVKKKHGSEPEFVQTVEEVLS